MKVFNAVWTYDQKLECFIYDCKLYVKNSKLYWNNDDSYSRDLTTNEIVQILKWSKELEITQTHELKTDSNVFQAVVEGLKTYEIRLNDRNYQIGDTLILQETEYTGDEMKQGQPLVYTGKDCRVIITHILYGPIYGLREDWVILSIRLN